MLALLLGIVLAGGAHAQQPVAREPAAEGNTGLLFFLSAEAYHFSDRASTTSRKALNEDAPLSADVVLTASRNKFRLFGEYLLTTREHDLERFQLGYEPVADTLIWLGRFHQPASAWNSEHHHGRYLQTAITRPSVELWEDESGILPQHLTGVLVESRVPLGAKAGTEIQLGGGLAPRIERGDMEPFDLLSPSKEGRRMAWSGRLAYLPDLVSPTRIGLLAARYRLPVADPAASGLGVALVAQDVVGGFGVLHTGPWHLVAAVYDVRIALDGVKESFQAGYLQLERVFGDGITLYGRSEGSSGADASRYIAVDHRSFELRSAVAGLRWDFRSRQALSLEAGRSTTLDGHRTELRLQWSAAFQ